MRPSCLRLLRITTGGRYDAALGKIDELGVVRERETRSDVLKELVADSIEEFKAGRKPIIIAPIHRDGKEFAEALRASMKGEGMLGQQDHEIARLERCDLSESQKADAVHYEIGQLVEFHQRVQGGFKSGEQWEVSRKSAESVCGQERPGKAFAVGPGCGL